MTSPGGRVLALDPGERRIGVALSDELGILASPALYPPVRARERVEAVAGIVREHGVVGDRRRLPEDAARRDRAAGPAGRAVRRGAARRSRRTGEVMGRTVLDGGGEGPPGRAREDDRRPQAVQWPPRPGGGAPRGRRGGGGDPSGVSGLATFFKFVIVLVAIALIAGAGLFAYSVFNGMQSVPEMVRGGLGQLDTPVSDDSRPVVVHRPARACRPIEIGDDLYAKGLIRSPLTFRTLVEARGVGSQDRVRRLPASARR